MVVFRNSSKVPHRSTYSYTIMFFCYRVVYAFKSLLRFVVQFIVILFSYVCFIELLNRLGHHLPPSMQNITSPNIRKFTSTASSSLSAVFQYGTSVLSKPSVSNATEDISTIHVLSQFIAVAGKVAL